MNHDLPPQLLRLHSLAAYHRAMERSREACNAAWIARKRGLRSRARRMLLQRFLPLPD